MAEYYHIFYTRHEHINKLINQSIDGTDAIPAVVVLREVTSEIESVASVCFSALFPEWCFFFFLIPVSSGPLLFNFSELFTTCAYWSDILQPTKMVHGFKILPPSTMLLLVSISTVMKSENKKVYVRTMKHLVWIWIFLSNQSIKHSNWVCVVIYKEKRRNIKLTPFFWRNLR